MGWIRWVWDNKHVGWIIAKVWAWRHRKWRTNVEALVHQKRVVGWIVTYWPPDKTKQGFMFMWGDEATCRIFNEIVKEKPKP